MVGGNNNNSFRAFDADNGEKVWEFDTQTGVVAAPITYELTGWQAIHRPQCRYQPGG
ncbi:MAG: hypothetical protein RQ899_03995 [Pseudomonadales bacterium]|nr:hypothetical protein [Pseudomonadales bacterium]